MTIRTTKITRTTAFAGAAGVTAAVLVAATTLLVAQQPAQAFPAYAQKTDLHCAMCHVKSEGRRSNQCLRDQVVHDRHEGSQKEKVTRAAFGGF